MSILQISLCAVFCSSLSDQAELEKVLSGFSNVVSYSFTITTETDGASFGGGTAGRGPGATSQATDQSGTSKLTQSSEPTLGIFEKGKPIFLTSNSPDLGMVELYRDNSGSAYSLNGSGTFEFIALDAKSAEVLKTAEKGTQRAVAMTFRLSQLMAPHQLFSEFKKMIGTSQKIEGQDRLVFSGSLSALGAESLSGGIVIEQARKESTGRGPKLSYSGDFEIVTDTAGNPKSLRIKTKTGGERRGVPFERIKQTTFEITEIGTSQVDAPSPALALLK